MWHYKRHALFWGFLLIFIGLLLYADKVTDLDLGDILANYWPVIIILVGVYIILMNIGVSKKQKRQATWNFGDKTVIYPGVEWFAMNNNLITGGTHCYTHLLRTTHHYPFDDGLPTVIKWLSHRYTSIKIV